MSLFQQVMLGIFAKLTNLLCLRQIQFVNMEEIKKFPLTDFHPPLDQKLRSVNLKN